MPPVEAEASRAAELERRVAERTAALAEAEARFRAIFNSQFQFIGLLDPTAPVARVNQTALDGSRIDPRDVVGRPFWETGWWPASERDRVRQELPRRPRVPWSAAKWRSLAPAAAASGSTSRSSRCDRTGAVMWIIPEGRDITEQRRLSAQLLQAQKVQALGQLASGIAHDFNNILQAVAGAATLIERRP